MISFLTLHCTAKKVELSIEKKQLIKLMKEESSKLSKLETQIKGVEFDQGSKGILEQERELARSRIERLKLHLQEQGIKIEEAMGESESDNKTQGHGSSSH